MIVWSEEVGDELPYRIEINSLRGAGKTPTLAILAALSVGGIISPGTRSWVRGVVVIKASKFSQIDQNTLISILERNEFPQ